VNFILLSSHCGHCVHIGVFLGWEQLADFTEGLEGTSCPVCGGRVRKDDILALTTSEDARNAEAGVSPWNNAAPAPEGFGGFRGGAGPQRFQAGAFARGLRDRVRDDAQDERRDEYAKVSKAVMPLVAFGEGRKAYDDGDFAKAALWCGHASDCEVENAATHALICLYLGISLGMLGESEKAEPALAKAARHARQCVGDDPPEQVEAVAGLSFQAGVERGEAGDDFGSRAAYRFSVDMDVPRWSARAAVNLGKLQDEDGDPAAAKDLWDYALANGEGRTKDLATYNIAWYWEEMGDRKQAVRYYRKIARGSDESLAARARGRISELR
jgi:tetratricopeptide (TPR) repeat protein